MLVLVLVLVLVMMSFAVLSGVRRRRKPNAGFPAMDTYLDTRQKQALEQTDGGRLSTCLFPSRALIFLSPFLTPPPVPQPNNRGWTSRPDHSAYESWPGAGEPPPSYAALFVLLVLWGQS